MSKFYEPEVQTVVQHNRNTNLNHWCWGSCRSTWILRSNNHGVLHSYDAINNQENDDLQSQIQNDSNDSKESFNNQISDHLAPSTELQPAGEITTYNQPLEISNDDLWKPVRSLNTQQCKAYDKIKSMNSLKPELTALANWIPSFLGIPRNS